MRKLFTMIAALMLIGTCATFVGGCKKDQGPAETMGEQVDNAATDAAKTADKAADDAKDAVRDATGE